MSQRVDNLDNEILEHAEAIAILMEAKGFKDDSKECGVSFITINLWHDDTIEVESAIQGIKTRRRKTK